MRRMVLLHAIAKSMESRAEVNTLLSYTLTPLGLVPGSQP